MKTIHMRHLILFICFIIVSPAFSQKVIVDEVKDPIDWVNPLMGTDSKPSLSHGNVYPAIALPWGMNFWTPQTGKMGSGWAYQYSADKIRGFKQTHQPSPWMNDYGQFSLMPITGDIKVDEDERASWFSHKSEEVSPYYYRVYLADHDVTTELVPTERAARFRIAYPATDGAHLVIDAFDDGSYVKVIPEENKVIGYTTKNSGGVPENFRNYFVIYFDAPISSAQVYEGNDAKSGNENEGEHAKAVITFDSKDGKTVEARVASSFISYEQAERNLTTEIADKGFDDLKKEGRDIWNKELSRIEVEGGEVDQIKTFYSCLYRSLLFPRKFFEYDEEGNVVHYSPYNGEVLPGYMFTDTGFWDTFRSLFPFLNLMYPELNAQMQEGLANAYKESGWLPEWASPGLRNVMIGNNSASVVSDAYLKIGQEHSYDIETLYEALLHGANNAGPLTAVGRAGVEYYNDLGYVPYDVGINENAARTLEYAYNDFTIYKLAKALNKPKEEIELYKKRSLNYKNLFDPETNLMRGKNEDGTFQSPFNPFKWGDAFTEGNSWHYTWSVFHDVAGLIDLMGGKEGFVSQLDKVFELPPIFDESYYSSVIHEIREMQIADMGQYAHGNQPIQHMIYLYNYAEEPWKAQKWLRETMNRMYRPTPDGYCGDEDNGQTSAWYVFSAMGFYPVAPGTDEYVMGAPLFRKMTLHLQNGNEVVISAPKNGRENLYVHNVNFNGEAYSPLFFNYFDLMDGANIEFEMTDKPQENIQKSQKDLPYSLSTANE
ncbi:GH92 family glycosyl hydrolase [Litoribacter ruber]|uniref:GH92 family glycosyl hydrolase n=1 Tax=Litoribacter ruber TaxID=702568 RepID=UPI001FE59175|nr:GH92 family glycosyl hydrolase [Litoribacter ruber]